MKSNSYIYIVTYQYIYIHRDIEFIYIYILNYINTYCGALSTVHRAVSDVSAAPMAAPQDESEDAQGEHSNLGGWSDGSRFNLWTVDHDPCFAW